MSGFMGMDVAWVLFAGSTLDTLGAEIRGIMGNVDRVRNESSDPKKWSGADQQRFAGWYDTEGREALRKAAEMLTSLAVNFRRNAAGQQRVSA